MAPPLFAELVDRFGSKLPSDETLTDELIQRAFIPSSALSVVGVFRRSFEFVDMQTKDDVPPVEQHQPVPMVPRVSEVAKTLKQDDPCRLNPTPRLRRHLKMLLWKKMKLTAFLCACQEVEKPG